MSFYRFGIIDCVLERKCKCLSEAEITADALFRIASFLSSTVKSTVCQEHPHKIILS